MIGKTVSHYRILSKLGAGGMGVVYQAEDTKLKRPVALKFLPPELTRDDQAKTRFIHEAQAASALQHNNICAIHEIDETPEGQLFISMDCYQGETLKEKIARGPFSVEDAVDIASQVAAGLSKAHEAGMVHRDVKPANIMVTSDGVVKILDFGLAKLAGMTKVTKTGTTVGTVAYMSPEQARGEEVDARSDIFSLGAVLYEMLTGQVPFPGDHEAAVLYGIMHGEPKSLTSLRGGMPSELQRIIDRCLAKIAAERYDAATNLLTDLRRLQREAGGGEGSVPGGVKEAGTSRRRWLWLVPIVVGAALVLYKILAPAGEKPTVGESTTARPNWILVADFEGPKDDPNLAVAVRELVVSSLTESRVVTPLSRSDLKRGLEIAMKPDTTRIVGETARELAYRAAARVYVEGRVDRIASGYSVVVNVLDAGNGKFVFSLRATAEKQDDLIPKLDAVARELRQKLGERASSVASARASTEVMTTSFEAFRRYVEALDLHDAREYEMSIQAARRALRLDPDLANAWTLIGHGFWSLGKSDSARVAYREALCRPGRLTERQLRTVTAQFDSFADYDLERGLAEWDDLISDAPTPSDYNSHGLTLYLLGRSEESLQYALLAKDASPYKPSSLVLNNIFNYCLSLGRYDEARDIVSLIPDTKTKERRMLHLALALGDRTSADRILAGDLYAAGWPQEDRVVLAFLDAARGSMRNAVSQYESAIKEEKIDNDFAFGHCLRMMHIVKISGVKNVAANFSICADTTVPGLVIDGISAAFAGDSSSASRFLGEIRRQPVYLQRKFATDIAVLDAGIAAVEERWDKVLELLEPLEQEGRMPAFSGRLPIRWLVAEANDKMGRVERAAESYERVVSPIKLTALLAEVCAIPPYRSFAHHRLVLLYAQLGRVEEARKHYDAFRAAFTGPDPELAPMLEEARVAVARLESR